MTRIHYLFAAASLFAVPATALAVPATGPVRNVVLVHGAFADGSGWKGVADILTKDGYKVSVVQQPETSLAADIAATNRIIDRQPGPVVLVGHSYAGAIITEAGRNPKVASLVYVAAFVPDQGETITALLKRTPPAANSIGPIGGGFLIVDPAKFPTDFAADLPAGQRHFLAVSQVPVAAEIFSTPIAVPAWKSKPSFGIVAKQDRMINPDLERSGYRRAHSKVTELNGSHAIFVSQPRAVANVIEQAAQEGR
jgi:pimeloyl-ACP methyl ester carboxylesterase